MSDDQELPAEKVARRTIRSFVIRGGRSTTAQQRALDELWPKYGIEFSDTPIDLDAHFGRHAARMIEIGFGAGEALLAFAQLHPEMDCLGIEVHPPGVGRLLQLRRVGSWRRWTRTSRRRYSTKTGRFSPRSRRVR